jgi:hypothetical protein
MAFVAALAPYLATAGAAYSAVQKSNAANFNSKVEQDTQNLSIDQANIQEGQVRNQSRQALGRQEAAFGAAGVGYGGSSATALDQSALNQEKDALNTRYKGALTGWGYGVQASQDKSEAQGYDTQGLLLAGGKALSAASPYFTTSPPPLPQPSAAITSPGLAMTQSQGFGG